MSMPQQPDEAPLDQVLVAFRQAAEAQAALQSDAARLLLAEFQGLCRVMPGLGAMVPPLAPSACAPTDEEAFDNLPL